MSPRLEESSGCSAFSGLYIFYCDFCACMLVDSSPVLFNGGCKIMFQNKSPVSSMASILLLTSLFTHCPTISMIAPRPRN